MPGQALTSPEGTALPAPRAPASSRHAVGRLCNSLEPAATPSDPADASRALGCQLDVRSYSLKPCCMAYLWLSILDGTLR